MNKEIFNPHEPYIMSVYKYKLISTHDNSSKYGNCEVCGKYASEVFHQIEAMKIEDGWTYANCHNKFGHEQCLISLRKTETPT